MTENRFASHQKPIPWIKICGLTDPDAASACAGLGADAIGLVFFEKSPRCVTYDQATEISTRLPQSAISIGVFVDAGFDSVMDTVKKCRLKGVQLHGNEPPALVEKLASENLVVIKALFAQKAPFMDQAAEYQTASFLLIEYGRGHLPGGNAETWDYRQCAALSRKYPLILAGGLDPLNVVSAVNDALPAAVDVSSGVEKAPGIKDLGKVERFIRAVKTTRSI